MSTVKVAPKSKKGKEPVKTSDRKRPNKRFIEQMAILRGGLTKDEQTQLATLSVKNALQRVNNRAMSEDQGFTTSENAKLQSIMKQAVKDINKVLNKK